ncbi:MAG: PilZ domain-containing protein [Myxococcota bacterium]
MNDFALNTQQLRALGREADESAIHRTGPERRGARRLPVVGLAELDNQASGELVDLSETGAQLALDRPSRVGAEHMLRIHLLGSGEETRRAQVVWAGQRGRAHLVGLRFLA